MTLTAVNDSILPLSDSTMPVRMGGETYVPYSVFTSLGVSASSGDGVLNLSANGETLSFSTAEGYVYDQNLTSYATPAYDLNGTVYVPVKLCCAKFGLTYSTLTISGESVLRVTDGSAQSDAAFIASKTGVIENTIDSYNGVTPSVPSRNENTGGNGSIDGSTGTTGQPTPNDQQTEMPKVEEKPAKKPSRVYLAFYGAPNEHTAEILDTLRDAGKQAAFFLPTDTEKWDDDLVRRIAAEGHTAALLLNAGEDTPASELTANLAAANERLSFLTGLTTRIAANQKGSDVLTDDQRNAVVNAGFRLWDAGLDSGDAERTAAAAYTATVQYFASTEGAVVVRLHHSKSTAKLTEALCSYMGRQGILAGHISFSVTPINSAADMR